MNFNKLLLGTIAVLFSTLIGCSDDEGIQEDDNLLLGTWKLMQNVRTNCSNPADEGTLDTYQCDTDQGCFEWEFIDEENGRHIYRTSNEDAFADAKYTYENDVLEFCTYENGVKFDCTSGEVTFINDNSFEFFLPKEGDDGCDRTFIFERKI